MRWHKNDCKARLLACANAYLYYLRSGFVTRWHKKDCKARICQ